MILYRYFAKEVFFTMLAVASIVLIITMGWRFSGYLNQAASGTLTKDILFLIMLYRLPGFLELILPISFFLAIMLAYGRLHVDSEMVVMESCGMSPTKLVIITLCLSGFVMAMTGIISLWLKPTGEEKVERLFADQQSKTEFDVLAPGRFQSLRSGKRVTYAESLGDAGELSQVFINEHRHRSATGAKTVVTVQAERGATVVDGNGNRFLVLKDGTRYNGTAGTEDYQVIHYEEYGQFIAKEKTNQRSRRRSAVSTQDLFKSKTPRFRSELQWRFSVILMIPIIAVMAIPLSKVNPRQGRYTRLVPGMILCFLYVVSLSAARSAMEKQQIPLGLGIWWIHGVYLIIVLFLFQYEKVLILLRALQNGKKISL